VTKLLPTLTATVLVFLASGRTDSRAEETNEASLRVCLNENQPPFSVRTNEGSVGFDVLVAQSLAERLGRRLAVQWYESKLDEDSNMATEANALLSDGRCDLVAGFPLMKDALGKPGLETAKMPDFAGAKPGDRRRPVTLGSLAATTPYYFAGFTVALGAGAKDRHIGSLADLDGFNLTVESGTLSDTILMTFDHGRFVSRIAHLPPGRGELFPRLESGEADATVIPVHRLDAYRIDHPDTTLMPSGYFLPVGFNIGFVGLAQDAQLIAQANAAIEAMLKDGEPPSFAQATHVTYLPPRHPYVQDNPLLVDLSR
jgi:ABC-type amino acid transport substrate-binding protein